MKKPVFSCSNVFDKRVTLHCHQYFENFLYMFYIQGVRKSLHILHWKVKVNNQRLTRIKNEHIALYMRAMLVLNSIDRNLL